MESQKPRWGAGAALLIAAAILAGMLVLLVIFTTGIKSEILLPVLAIVGVIALLLALALTAGAFSIFELSDKQQALGLPEGSVRAVIALSLLVLFAILSVYLYANVSRPPIEVKTGLQLKEKEEFLRNIPSTQIVTTIEEPPKDGKQLFTVVWKNNNPAGDDFAKQLLVLIGTLVTSVSSFYFGSKTAAAAVPPPAVTPEPTPRPDPAPKPGPAITAVTPNSTPSGGATSIQISGVNLGGTKQVKLSQGAAVVDATDVKPSAGAVTCMVLLPSIGAWDVTLTDSAGHETKKVDAITAK